jgi:hypothetical protein
MPHTSLTIVVDPAFGELPGAAARGPVWIANTAQNRKEAEKLWLAGAKDVTTFNVGEPFDPESEVAGVLGQVLLHHPDVQEVRVFGCSPAGVRDRFARDGFEVSEESRGGFVARS